MASQINASNSGFGGIVSTGDSSGVLQLQTTGTTAVTIDTSQNVGIGATTLLNPGSPDAKTLTVSATKYPQIFSIATTAAANNTTYRTIVRDTGVYQIQLINDAGTSEQTAYEISRTANSVTYQRWFGGTTEAMRIASDGIVTISKGVSGTPAFAAYQSTGVALTGATFTKITFQTEEYDTNSNFASSRFTPTVAGYYQINGAWQFGSGGTVTVCAIYKNGTIYKQGTAVGGTAGYGGAVSSLVYFNGSSDYVELYGYASSAKTPLATIDATYFNGALVRGA